MPDYPSPPNGSASARANLTFHPTLSSDPTPAYPSPPNGSASARANLTLRPTLSSAPTPDYPSPPNSSASATANRAGPTITFPPFSPYACTAA